MKTTSDFLTAQYEMLNEAKALMHQGALHFSYEKADGTLRQALGTLNFELIPSADLPTGNGRFNGYDEGYQPYYDLERAGWRCFNVTLLRWIETETRDGQPTGKGDRHDCK